MQKCNENILLKDTNNNKYKKLYSKILQIYIYLTKNNNFFFIFFYNFFLNEAKLTGAFTIAFLLKKIIL